MTSERGFADSDRDWRSPGWWLGLLALLFSLHAAFAHAGVTADEAQPLVEHDAEVERGATAGGEPHHHQSAPRSKQGQAGREIVAANEIDDGVDAIPARALLDLRDPVVARRIDGVIEPELGRLRELAWRS